MSPRTGIEYSDDLSFEFARSSSAADHRRCSIGEPLLAIVRAPFRSAWCVTGGAVSQSYEHAFGEGLLQPRRECRGRGAQSLARSRGPQIARELDQRQWVSRGLGKNTRSSDGMQVGGVAIE